MKRIRSREPETCTLQFIFQASQYKAQGTPHTAPSPKKHIFAKNPNSLSVSLCVCECRLCDIFCHFSFILVLVGETAVAAASVDCYGRANLWPYRQTTVVHAWPKTINTKRPTDATHTPELYRFDTWLMQKKNSGQKIVFRGIVNKRFSAWFQMLLNNTTSFIEVLFSLCLSVCASGGWWDSDLLLLFFFLVDSFFLLQRSDLQYDILRLTMKENRNKSLGWLLTKRIHHILTVCALCVWMWIDILSNSNQFFCFYFIECCLCCMINFIN